MLKWGLLFLVLLSLPALAKDEGIFDILVQRKGPHTKIKLGVWDCKTSMNSTFREVLANHTGGRKSFKRERKNEGQASVFQSPTALSQTIRKEMSVPPPISVEVIEKCTHDYQISGMVQTCDANGCSNVPGLVDQTDTMKIQWNCRFTDLPNAAGQSRKVNCVDSDSNGQVYSQKLFNKIRAMSFEGIITLRERVQTVAVDLCNGRNLRHRKIIKLTQGIEGLPGENDFVVQLDIPGLSEPVVLRKKEGVLNDEISICRKGDIQTTVSIKEQDIFLDDKYTCDQRESTVLLSTRNPKRRTAMVNFQRKGLLEKILLDGKHQLKLEIRNAPL